MRRLFGTDGIRGTANQEPMTADTMLRMAQAVGAEFLRGNHRHLVVIGKDTRLSGYMLEPALTAGFISIGMDVALVGPMPTPAVAMLTRTMRADLGVVISASHNPYTDNGLKFFGPDGYKLPDELETRIEARLSQGAAKDLAPANALGRARRLDDAPGRYIEFAKNSFPKGRRLDGIKIVLDCANGAAYKLAPTIFWELGADVITLGTDPNGLNINENCGATSPQILSQTVLDNKADLGIALDGDADRLIIVDEQGKVVDGDQILAMITRSWMKENKLTTPKVVSTIMANLGLEHYLESAGLGLVRAPVGDRYVVDIMRRQNINIGGEPSGHIVLSDYATTGDGIISALQVLAVLLQEDKPASACTRVFTPYAQVLQNIRIADPSKILSCDQFKDVMRQVEERLGRQGRIVVRKSGTEPLLRIMAESENATDTQWAVNTLIEAAQSYEPNCI